MPLPWRSHYSIAQARTAKRKLPAHKTGGALAAGSAHGMGTCWTLLWALECARHVCALEVPPSLTIDLSQQPGKRWDGTVAAILARHPYHHSFGPVFAAHNKTLFQALSSEDWTILGNAMRQHWPETAAELGGISAQFAAAGHSEVSFEYLVGWVYFHELAHTHVANHRLHSGCTGVVAQTQGGAVLQGGNMDQSPPAVRNLTLRLRFVDGAGRTVFEGTDWYAVLTTGVTRAVRRGLASVQGNWRHGTQRPLADTLADISSGITAQTLLWRRYFVAAHMKDLAGQPTSFEAFVRNLMHVHLAAPFYVVAAGPSQGEGVVLTRGLAGVENIAWLGVAEDREQKEDSFLCQCNADRWLPDDPDDPRRTAAELSMRNLGPAEAESLLGLLAVASTFPVHNPNTAYTALMSASTGELHVYVRQAVCPLDPRTNIVQQRRYCHNVPNTPLRVLFT